MNENRGGPPAAVFFPAAGGGVLSPLLVGAREKNAKVAAACRTSPQVFPAAGVRHGVVSRRQRADRSVSYTFLASPEAAGGVIEQKSER
ncbi:hypothetical protein K9U39_05570 [Rhodoblastus acidophilus]|uniref:Uncharacterized protein n=1 Tax=Candidatus Rhodoblastus alkanivorans TaxID=2954117 RepID=A0ABS9Z613_9HYPH|nr:hypothetical protein [Candidatus Rhodoblastus alkanivorans]MCI4680291.1 hypothetical protein [Candidatus Rhodoblastus alkanivorans]MCI4683110.1 hypothetical protein [Candidatus Rhodoblastus alkanivorans]MDI4640421.1 hypothetical protein [Rhodoblastus acidophilus]